VTIVIPTTINTAEFVAFLRDELGGLADGFGWTTEDSVSQLAIDALMAAGMTSFADATTARAVQKVKAVAKVLAWRKASALTAGDFDFSADGGRYDRAQVHENAKKQAINAEREAELIGIDLSGANTVYAHRVFYADDTSDDTAIVEWRLS
jgi:hypothetical protein